MREKFQVNSNFPPFCSIFVYEILDFTLRIQQGHYVVIFVLCKIIIIKFGKIQQNLFSPVFVLWRKESLQVFELLRSVTLACSSKRCTALHGGDRGDDRAQPAAKVHDRTFCLFFHLINCRSEIFCSFSILVSN